VSPIDVGVLVGERVSRMIDDQLHRRGQTRGATHAVGGRKSAPPLDRARPEKRGDGHINRVLPHWIIGKDRPEKPLAGAAVRAGKTEVARKQGKQADRSGRLLAEGRALRAPSLHDERPPCAGQLARERGDARRGAPGDARGPLRRFRHSVRALPQHVSAVALRGGCARGHRRAVVADTVPMKEFLIGKALGDEHPGHAGHEGRIGAGADGDPRIALACRRIALARIDRDYPERAPLPRGLLARLRETMRSARPAHARERRVGAEKHHQIGMGRFGKQRAGVVAVIAVQRHARRLQLHAAVVAIDAQVSAVTVHQPFERRAGARPYRRRIGKEHRLVAPLRHRVADALRNLIEGLIPTDRLELARPSRPHPAQRLIQAIGAAQPIAQGPTTQARAHLQIAGLLVAAVGFRPEDLALARPKRDPQFTAQVCHTSRDPSRPDDQPSRLTMKAPPARRGPRPPARAGA